MNTNSANDLPCWAREALGYAGAPLAGDTDPEGRPYPRAGWCPEGFAERVAARWLEIERDVLPPLAVLSDTGKCRLFFAMFGMGRNVAVAGGLPRVARAARAAVRELDAINMAIADTACELAQLIGRRKEISESGLAEHDGMPDLWELLEEAAADYPHWKAVASSYMGPFLRIATGQSRAGPDIGDILCGLARHCELSPPAQASDPALRNRQASQADYVRLVLDTIDRFPRRRADGRRWGHEDSADDAARLPADFALPDAALAALVSVVFDLPEGQPSVEAVRACRLSWRQRPDADDLTAPRARRPPLPPAAPAPRPARTDPVGALLTQRWSH